MQGGRQPRFVEREGGPIAYERSKPGKPRDEQGDIGFARARLEWGVQAASGQLEGTLFEVGAAAALAEARKPGTLHKMGSGNGGELRTMALAARQASRVLQSLPTQVLIRFPLHANPSCFNSKFEAFRVLGVFPPLLSFPLFFFPPFLFFLGGGPFGGGSGFPWCFDSLLAAVRMEESIADKTARNRWRTPKRKKQSWG